MRVKQYIIIAMLGLTNLSASIVKGEILAGIYYHSPSGGASYTLPGEIANATADLENTLGWKKENDIIFQADFKHSLPFFPNLKIGYTNLLHAGKNNTTDFFWGGIVSFDGLVSSSLDLEFYDITPYYEIVDNIVEADLWITLRKIEGQFSVNTFLQNETTNLDSLVPMLYGKAKVAIPNTGFSAICEANAISTSETAFYDYQISIRYTLGAGFGLEGGYKVVHLDSEELADGLKTDIDFQGPYTMLTWSF